jgi:hypothetical protein
MLGFVEVHNVLTAPRTGADQNQLAKDRGAFEGHLLRNHSAEREAEHIACLQFQTVQESECMRRHAGDGRGYGTARATDAGVLE